MERVLTVTGCSDNIKRAYKEAMHAIAKHGESGGRKTAAEQKKQQEQEKARLAAGGSRRREGAATARASDYSHPSAGLIDAGLDDAATAAQRLARELGPMQPAMPPPARCFEMADATLIKHHWDARLAKVGPRCWGRAVK